jgi:predicted DCC family thiol-disulfide oxidoreductase YuxK
MRTLLYDGECGFCRWVTGLLLRWDAGRRLRPLALQDALAAELLPGMSEEDRFASFHVVGDDGEIRSGGRALPYLVGELPHGGRPAALMTALQPLTDLAYRLISANRSRLGPLVPTRWKAEADQRIRRRQAELGGDVVEEAADELTRAQT